MSSQPTRDEILEKYRDRIDAADFEVLAATEFPPPSQLQSEGAWLEYLGPLKGMFLYLKRSMCGPIAVIAMFGGLMQGIEYIDKYSRLGYDKVVRVIQLACEYCDRPADEYVIAVSNPEEWDKRVPFQLPNEVSYFDTTTTSTTTTAEPQQPTYELPGGSGLVPFSRDWPGIS